MMMIVQQERVPMRQLTTAVSHTYTHTHKVVGHTLS